jgi:hypothetical protein
VASELRYGCSPIGGGHSTGARLQQSAEVPEPVKLEFDLQETVAIGSFNPAIITPDWLSELGLCTVTKEDALRYANLTSEDAFVAGGFEWEVDSGRLAVIAAAPDRDCGAMVAKVLKELPHTPIQAIGHNFQCACRRSEWSGVQPVLGQLSGDVLEADEVRWDGRFRSDGGWTEITLRVPTDEADFVAITFNHHHFVEGASVKERNTKAIAAANCFGADRAKTQERLQALFGVG